MLIRPLRLGRFWPILYIKFFEVYLSQSNRETFCCNLFQVKCYISPATVVITTKGNRSRFCLYKFIFFNVFLYLWNLLYVLIITHYKTNTQQLLPDWRRVTPWTVIDSSGHNRCLSSRFYRAMYCIRGTSHRPLSVCVRLSVCVCSKSEFYTTRSSAIAEGPRDALCQLKSCQLPRNSTETTYTTSPDQIDGMKLAI